MRGLSDKAAAALAQAYAKQGKHKGKLLARCPASHTLAAAAWQAAMLNCNPFKFSIGALMFMSDEQREVYREVNDYFETLPREYRVRVERDRNALEKLGVW